MQHPMTEVIAVRRFWWEHEPMSAVTGEYRQANSIARYRKCVLLPDTNIGFGDDEQIEAIFGVEINMVLRYAHPTQEHQTKAMDKMERYVSEQKIAHAERTAPQMSYAVQ